MALVEMIVNSVRHGSLREDRSLILQEKMPERSISTRYLAIHLDESNAKTIERLLLQELVDPAELDLSSMGIDKTLCQVESVIINKFENNVFNAELVLSQDNKRREVDCPASKAVAHAIKAKASIFVDEVVLNEAGIAAPA
jgi:bifunctional DNase/RNase